jgi:hypothetical protein
MTLVDHSRRIMRSRKDAVASEFAERKAELVRNPEIRFIQELRNFTLHRAIPFLGHSFTFTTGTDPAFTSEVELGVAQLRGWDGWSESSLAFLENQGEAVVLRPTIRRHGQLVLGLNSWLLDALMAANQLAREEVNDLVAKRNAILAGQEVYEPKIN